MRRRQTFDFTVLELALALYYISLYLGWEILAHMGGREIWWEKFYKSVRNENIRMEEEKGEGGRREHKEANEGRR